MNRASRFHLFFAGGRSALLAAALIVTLGACGKQDGLPNPPSSPPRPTTTSLPRGHVTTADLRLHMLPPRPMRGWM